MFNNPVSNPKNIQMKVDDVALYGDVIKAGDIIQDDFNNINNFRSCMQNIDKMIKFRQVFFVNKNEQNNLMKNLTGNKNNENKFFFIVEPNKEQSLVFQHTLNKFVDNLFKENNLLMIFKNIRHQNQEKGQFQFICSISPDFVFINFLKQNKEDPDESFFKNISEYTFGDMIFLIMKGALDAAKEIDPKTDPVISSSHNKIVSYGDIMKAGDIDLDSFKKEDKQIVVKKDEQQKKIKDFIENKNNENKIYFKVEINKIQSLIFRYILNESVKGALNSSDHHMYLSVKHASNKKQGCFGLICLFNNINVDRVIIELSRQNKNFLQNISGCTLGNIISRIMQKFLLKLKGPKIYPIDPEIAPIDPIDVVITNQKPDPKIMIKSYISQLKNVQPNGANICALLKLIIRIYTKLNRKDRKEQKYKETLKEYKSMFIGYSNMFQFDETKQDELFKKLGCLTEQDELFQNSKCSSKNFDEDDLKALLEKLYKITDLVQLKEQEIQPKEEESKEEEIQSKEQISTSVNKV